MVYLIDYERESMDVVKSTLAPRISAKIIALQEKKRQLIERLYKTGFPSNKNMTMDIIENPEENLTVGNYNSYIEFKAWVEQTKLFQTIVFHSGTNTIIEGISENRVLSLAVSNRKITTFEELPKELLREFFINSPWYKPIDNPRLDNQI